MKRETDLVSTEQRNRLRRAGTDLCFCADRLDRKQVRESEPSDEELSVLSEAEREVLSPLLDDGYEIVGTGVAQCVLRFPVGSALDEYVVKLARFGPSTCRSGSIRTGGR